MYYVICEQQRRRSACASAQSDQRLCFRCIDSVISLVSVPRISNLMLASVAEQAGFSLTWSETPEDRFLMTRLIGILTISNVIPRLLSAFIHVDLFT